MASRKLCSMLSNLAFEYETPKIVTIRDIKVGVIYRLMQLAIIAYVVGYTILYTKGYQDRERGQSTVLTKVKGVSSSYDRQDIPEIYRKVWDPSDYIIPPLTPNSVFVTTNLVITARQSLGKCPEDPNNKKYHCLPENAEKKCPKGRVQNRGNGQMTSRCVPVFNSTKTNFTCEIISWCPLEDDTIISRFLDQPILDNAENFTVFFKNYVEFPYFGVKRRNLDAVGDEYAKKCFYNPETDPLCPIFRLGDIANLMGQKFTQLSSYGSVINVQIKWMCNLDFNVKKCIPEVKFSDMDDLDSSFSPGYNFRFANYYRDENGTEFRDLIKAYGILFVFNVEAEAGKFSIVQLTLNVGAGLALLGLVSVFVDIFLVNFVKERHYYQEKKYITVSREELKQYITKKSRSSLGESLDPIH